MGFNDSLVGLGIATEEGHRVEASGGQSEGLRLWKPSRGAPPSLLSQPLCSDRSQSSSPSKSSRTPSVTMLPKSPSSMNSKTLPVSTTSRPSNSSKKPLASYYHARDNLQDGPFSLRGKVPPSGQGVRFKHHRFLPQTILASDPSSLSFQPQFPSSESHYTPNSFQAFEFKTPAPILPMTDISAKGEILPSSSISQQPSISSTSTTESLISENDLVIMSTTVESTSTQTFCLETSRDMKDPPCLD